MDVAIVGGGPGGCATALSLAAHAPSLSVALIEASDYQRPRVGESLPPAATRVLQHLGAWDGFRRSGHLEVHGTASEWGQDVVSEEEFLFSARGAGWHLDRAEFDRALAREARRRGAQLKLSTRLVSLRREGAGWRLGLSSGVELAAGFVVDGTGRRATVARSRGARFEALDGLVGYGFFFAEGEGSDPRTLVEAFEHGWWYTAGLPRRRRIVFCMTDLDIGRSLGLKDPGRWFAALASTRRVRALLTGATHLGSLLVRPSETRCLDRVVGERWLAVGDSASIFDPLSSQGITKALRAGVFAGYAVGDLLTRGDGAGLVRYRRYVGGEFDGYRKTRRDYYQAEGRWPDGEFWRRRRPRGDSRQDRSRIAVVPVARNEFTERRQ